MSHVISNRESTGPSADASCARYRSTTLELPLDRQVRATMGIVDGPVLVMVDTNLPSQDADSIDEYFGCHLERSDSHFQELDVKAIAEKAEIADPILYPFRATELAPSAGGRGEDERVSRRPDAGHPSTSMSSPRIPGPRSGTVVARPRVSSDRWVAPIVPG